MFDAGRGDGGDITLLSPKAASFAATEDGAGGFQLFVGQGCRDRVDAAALNGSWIIALLDPTRSLQGETIAKLSDLREGSQSNCPARLSVAFTRWYVEPVLPGSGGSRHSDYLDDADFRALRAVSAPKRQTMSSTSTSLANSARPVGSVGRTRHAAMGSAPIRWLRTSPSPGAAARPTCRSTAYRL